MSTDISPERVQAIEAAISMVPEHCRASLMDYVMLGQRPGGFLSAVLSNDLYGALCRADDINVDRMGVYAHCLNRLPSACWGSREAYEAWIEKGGLLS